MARYPDFKRAAWGNPWKRTACVVTAEDGTFGLGITTHGGPVEQIINGHFAPVAGRPGPHGDREVLGRDAADLGAVRQRRPGELRHQRRRQRPLGPEGQAARSAGLRAAGRPAEGEHPLLRQQHRPLVRRRAGIAWFLEVGFKAVKLFLTWGPEDGIEGIRKSEELVARTREQIGPDVELMVDAWMSLNVEYIVRLMDALRPYRVKWLEDYLLPEDTDSYIKVRQRLPGVTLATGEHWYTIHPFALAASQGLVDILQPDISWVGGMTAVGADLPHRRGPLSRMTPPVSPRRRPDLERREVGGVRSGEGPPISRRPPGGQRKERPSLLVHTFQRLLNYRRLQDR